MKKPVGVERDLMNWANNPKSSINVRKSSLKHATALYNKWGGCALTADGIIELIAVAFEEAEAWQAGPDCAKMGMGYLCPVHKISAEEFYQEAWQALDYVELEPMFEFAEAYAEYRRISRTTKHLLGCWSGPRI